MSTPILDAPDLEVQSIGDKLARGVPLSHNEQIRWAQRLHAERETVRQGGTIRQSVSPAQPSAFDVGKAETTQAIDYMRGRAEVMGQPPAVVPGGGNAAPASPYVSREGGSSLERTRADGMAIGLDGKPFNPNGGPVENRTKDPYVGSAQWMVDMRRQLDANRTSAQKPGQWNPPKVELTPEEKARGASVSFDPIPGVPKGYAWGKGADGGWWVVGPDDFVGDKLKDPNKRRTFANEADVMNYFASLNQPTSGNSGKPAASTSPTPPATASTQTSHAPAPAPAQSAGSPGGIVEAIRSLASQYTSVPQTLGGVAIPQIMPKASAAPEQLPSAESIAAAAVPGQTAPIQFGLLKNPGPWPGVPPVAITQQHSAPQAPSVPAQETPSAPTLQRYPVDAAPAPWHMPKPAPSPAPVASAPAPEAAIQPNVSTSSAPMFPNAIWNIPKSKQKKIFQPAADRYNPFSQRPRRGEQALTVIPE